MSVVGRIRPVRELPNEDVAALAAAPSTTMACAASDRLCQHRRRLGPQRPPPYSERTVGNCLESARLAQRFFRVNVWRGQAEHLADSLGKGDRVMVTGRLRQRSWETPEGDKRSVTELEADEVGASLKWATAKVERVPDRRNGERAQDRQRQAERGGDFNDAPPF
jgi:Single-strand binding protein family